MKWLIALILLITVALLNVIVLITLFTKETSCPQVINTTQMAQGIAQTRYVSCGNTTDEMILQQINNNITILIDLVGNSQQLVNNNNYYSHRHGW